MAKRVICDQCGNTIIPGNEKIFRVEDVSSAATAYAAGQFAARSQLTVQQQAALYGAGGGGAINAPGNLAHTPQGANQYNTQFFVELCQTCAGTWMERVKALTTYVV